MPEISCRILLVTHAGGSPHHGPNMRWYFLGQALRKLGVEVEIVSSGSFHKYIAPPELDRVFETRQVDDLTYHWIRTRPYRRRGVGQVLNQLEFTAKCRWFAGKLAKRKPDIVIASSPHPFVVYPAWHIAKRSGARYLYEVRDLWPAILMELGNFSPHHPYMVMNKMAERFAVRRAERILSVKAGELDYFSEQYDLPESRFAYIPNGFLPQETTAPAPDQLIQLRTRYRYLVGYTGAISAYYRLEDLVELGNAMRHRNDVGFVVVGGGDREDAIAQLARSHDLPHFHMLGKISRQGVPATLQLFDVCFVSVEETSLNRYGISCNKIYEYMHAGKPILGNFDVAHDPVQAADCGISVKPGDTAALAGALETLLEDDERSAKLGRNGREFFDATHHFDRVAEQLLHKVIDAA